MCSIRLRRTACVFFLCFGGVALLHCSLDTNGAGPAGQGVAGQGVGGDGGGGMGPPAAGAAGEGPGGGTGQGGSTGEAGAGTGGEGGGAGGGGGGAGGMGGLPNLLGCKPWLPGNSLWRYNGDAIQDGKRIVLAPAEGKDQWGQAFLNFIVGPSDKLEVAFTFAFEEGDTGGGFAEGAALWFTEGGQVFNPPIINEPTSLGVSNADVGAALVLDMNDKDAPNRPFWALYQSGINGSKLGENVAAEVNSAVLDASSASPQGPHSAILQMTPDGGALKLLATIKSASGDVTLNLDAANAAGALGGGVVGFSAGSTEGGAAHMLLGVEIKQDNRCVEPF